MNVIFLFVSGGGVGRHCCYARELGAVGVQRPAAGVSPGLSARALLLGSRTPLST